MCAPIPMWRFLSKAMAFVMLLSVLPQWAQALPAFARQTGQNCVACHAGGQFPELTPYGRMFKMTGYTIGRNVIPLSVMGVVSDSSVNNTSKSPDPRADFQKNNSLIFATGSVFAAGRLTDNIGMFLQWTYDNYGSQSADGKFHGHSNADNMDVRYADRFVSADHDFLYGVSVNNNPSVSDPWNTAAAWMQYVPVPSPTSSRFIDGATPYPGLAAGGNIAGITAYAFWDKLLYIEVGNYRTAKGALSPFSAGIAKDSKTKLQGNNPYGRIALCHEWGPHNAMVGATAMNAKVYDDPLDTSDARSVHRFRDVGIDAQYQYLLDPHSITLQLAYVRETHRYPYFLAGQPVQDVDGNPLPDTNAIDKTRTFRIKSSYIYDAKYGVSLAFFNLTGTTNSAAYDPTPTSGNISGSPAARGLTPEIFWMPVQYLRVGLQYTIYNKYNGAGHNYDGAGRNARDNNSLFFYLWAAY